MENIFLIVIIAIVGLVQLMMRAAEARKNAQAKKRSAPSARNATIVRAPAESEEERVRKFFEALGLPTTSSPPPRVQPSQAPPKKLRPGRRIMPVDPFPVPHAGQPYPPVTASTPSLPSMPESLSVPSPLPTRESSVFAEPSVSRTLDRPVEAEFEVRDIDEIVGDDLAPILSTRRAAREARPSKSKAGNMMARLANDRLAGA